MKEPTKIAKPINRQEEQEKDRMGKYTQKQKTDAGHCPRSRTQQQKQKEEERGEGEKKQTEKTKKKKIHTGA